MKKVISMAVLIAMLASGLPVSAAAPSLDFMNVSYKDPAYSNYSQSIEVDFELNKPIRILDRISEFVPAVNLGELVSTLFDSKITMQSEQITEKNGERIFAEVNMTADTPIRINKNLLIGVNQNYGIYFDMDLSDLQNPQFNYVMSTPLSDKYITMNNEDISHLENVQNAALGLEQNEQNSISEIFSAVFDEAALNEINSKCIEAIEKNAKITGNSSNITITFTDIGLKKYIADIMQLAIGMIDEESQKMFEEEFPTDEFAQLAKDVRFFGDKALVMNYELNDDGLLQYYEFELNVDFNFYDLMLAMEQYTDDLQREECDICFTVSGKSRTKYNTAVINIPKTDETNSISYSDFVDPYGVYEEDYGEDGEYVSEYSYISVMVDDEFIKNEKNPVPLRTMLENFYTVEYDDGKITAVKADGNPKYENICVELGSTVAKADGKQLQLNHGPFLIGDTSYISAADAQIILNAQQIYCNYYPFENFGYCDFEIYTGDDVGEQS